MHTYIHPSSSIYLDLYPCLYMPHIDGSRVGLGGRKAALQKNFDANTHTHTHICIYIHKYIHHIYLPRSISISIYAAHRRLACWAWSPQGSAPKELRCKHTHTHMYIYTQIYPSTSIYRDLYSSLYMPHIDGSCVGLGGRKAALQKNFGGVRVARASRSFHRRRPRKTVRREPALKKRIEEG